MYFLSQRNKSHRLPFGQSTLISKSLLDLVYTDVWSPSPSINGFSYYIIFVDHFTKYIRFYPLKKKLNITSMFICFKSIVENFFKTKIVSLYSNDGGEYIGLKSCLDSFGIQHLKTPPHTPQHNGYVERRYRHVIKTSLTLLHNASLPLSFWSYAFSTTIYLINRLSTPILKLKSAYESLCQSTPNYTKLRVFGCLCFLFFKPYKKKINCNQNLNNVFP